MPKKAPSKPSSAADKHRMQEIKEEIKIIGDRSTWLLGFLSVIVAALTAFVFQDLNQNSPRYEYAIALLIIYLGMTVGVLLVLTFSFVVSKDRVDVNEKRLNHLKSGFRFNIFVAFVSVFGIFSFVISLI